MKVEQIAIFLENKSGRLAEISQVLAENGINIRALSLADTADFGILRLLVNDIQKAEEVLKNSNFTVGRTQVCVVETPDKPGGLAKVLQIIKEAELNVEYMYAFAMRRAETGLIIFRFDDLDLAITALMKAGIRVLSGEEVYTI